MIFVDPAIGSADLAPLLEKVGLPVIVSKLEWADVEFVGRGIKGEPVTVGVEVKRLSELTGDWDRFAGHQVPKMVEHYDYRWVVYEGEWFQNKKGSLLKRVGARQFRPLHGQCNASALRKKLLTLEMCGGFHRIQTKDRADTIRNLVDLYRFWTDDDLDQHKSLLVLYEPIHSFANPSVLRRIAAILPGIGFERSRIVEKSFSSVRRMIDATIDQWACIDGIGKKTATKIVDALNGKD